MSRYLHGRAGRMSNGEEMAKNKNIHTHRIRQLKVLLPINHNHYNFRENKINENEWI